MEKARLYDQQKKLDLQPIEDAKTVHAAKERFLERQRNRVFSENIEPGRYDVIERSVNDFVSFVGANAAVARLEKGDLLEDYSSELNKRVYQEKKWTGAYADGYMGVARQFIHWCFKREIIDREPRNLHDADLSIAKSAKQVVPYTTDEIKIILGNCNPIMLLICLLMLNTGGTQKDLSDLHPDEIDWDNGTITRKRSKTKDAPNVPTVTYPLWESTFKLLKKYGIRTGDNVLLNRDGKKLITSELRLMKRGQFAGQLKFSKKDNLAVNYRRLINKLLKDKKLANRNSLKVFRKTSNSALKNNKDFHHFALFFMGHSPRGINEISYTAYSTKSFADAVRWLGEYYGIEKISGIKGKSSPVSS